MPSWWCLRLVAVNGLRSQSVYRSRSRMPPSRVVAFAVAGTQRDERIDEHVARPGVKCHHVRRTRPARDHGQIRDPPDVEGDPILVVRAEPASSLAHAEELTADDKIVRSFQHAPRPMADNRIPMDAILTVEYEKTRKPLQVPSKWDEEFAHYLGWLTGDGCIDVRDGNAVTVYGSDEDKDVVLPRHHALLTRITGFESKPSVQPNGTLQLRVTRQAFSQFLYQLGVAEDREAVAGAVAKWNAADLEEEIIAAKGAGGMARTQAEWARQPPAGLL